MRYHGLVGMAAPQIGINLRMFVTEVRKTRTRDPRQADHVRVFINPRIARFSKQKAFGYEGCGSVVGGGLFGEVKRSSQVSVIAYSLKGERFALEASDLLARIIQHETDHLDGRVFLDRMPNPKSFMSRGEYLSRKAK